MNRYTEDPLSGYRYPNSRWTPEHEFRLILLWADGQTCSQISESFKESGFDVSRNAVSAKVKRMRESGFPLEVRESPVFKRGNYYGKVK